MTQAVSTYVDLSRRSAARAIARARPRPESHSVVVTALDGLHAGRSTTPDGEAFIVSGELGAQVLLLDEGMSGITVKVRTERSMVGILARIETNASDATLNGATIATSRLSAPERLPADLRVGGVTLRLSASSRMLAAPSSDEPSQTAKMAFPGPRRYWIAATLGAACIGLGWAADQYPSTAMIVTGSPAAASPASPVHPDIPAGDLTTTSFADVIAGSPLADHLVTRADPDGTLRIAGALPHGLMPLWSALRARHDADTGSPVVASVEARPPLTTFPDIATVRHGDAPIVIFSDGSRAGVGDKVEDWTVERIEPGALTIGRSGEIETLTF